MSQTFHLPGNQLVGRLPPIIRSSSSSTSSSSSSSTSELFEASNKVDTKTLTRKEYLIAVRNRLFAVEEQLWLNEYALHHKNAKFLPLSEKKLEALTKAKHDLLMEYPLTQLHLDHADAQRQNLTYAALHLERLIESFHRQMPLPMNHVNQIAVLSYSGQVINLMRGQGAAHHRLLPSNTLTNSKVKRQFQHPTFSSSGKYVAFAEMHFQADGDKILRSDALVFEVPTDPTTFGSSDSTPLFDSGDLPGAPFFLRFSPNEEQLAMLCSAPNNETSIVLMDWAKYHRKDMWTTQAGLSKLLSRKALTLMKGKPVFFTYTTSSAQNATIVAHCSQEVPDEQNRTMITQKAVWMLAKQDTGGVQDFTWKKVSSCDNIRWNTPICHSAGGGDNVLVVEDGHLVSKALSRWKRNADGSLKSKRLMPVHGQVHFLVSPDSSRCVVLEGDINVGYYAMTVIEGESALDPASPDMGKRYELPNPKLTVAFWFSPDSTKVLCLSSVDKSKEDVSIQKSNFRVGLNAEMQWYVYNFPLEEMREYDVFKPTPYFMKTYVPFFTKYAQVYNPWAPDSRSFIYMTSSGLCHTPLVGSKYSLGMDKWQNEGATFGTWSHQ